MERIQAKKDKRCSADAWQELLVAMNSKKDRVVVSKASLTEVYECHVMCDGDQAINLGYKEKGYKFATVDRLALFKFVQDHGKICLRERIL